ncbi:hypothetical protein SAMN05428988_3214 [Chitinophaga sp. YR573]|uniref:hypothetical protein n=1 Tax=Chitinophaga sp. YR573 TaxID=1881040 RepID=UPI0008AFB48F|nr:hypothetical protein [Chitinophaga sp. YR573]SEW21473.1 hypothetical protein SAMN05428988_3214 [Chitinophaga sp. YR573]
MSKVGVISSIPLSEATTGYEGALAAVNLTRAPGTGTMFLPYKEKNNEYRTGLDAEAVYIRRISDGHAQKIEKEKVTKERQRLEQILKLDLSPRSDYYNISTWSPTAKNRPVIEPVKLGDGKTYFNLEDPLQAVAYAFLRVHPHIATSMEAYQRGDFPDARFYVMDDEVEQEITYRKKTHLNKAIFTLDNLSLEKRKKIARQCSLPVSDADKEQVVYNQLDSFIKQGVIKSGPFEGVAGVDIFMRFITISDEVLHVKDLVRQAITHSIYRRDKLSKLFEGEIEIAKSEEQLVDYLLDEKNQADILMLEDKLRAKKSILA